MKKVIFVLALLALVAFISMPAIADDNDTTHGYKDTADSWWHNHQIYDPDRRNPLGGGLDIVVFESDSILENITIESRYDVQNDEFSGYFVGRINLFQAVKNIIE